MSSIKVINTIRLCSKGVLAKDANGKYVKSVSYTHLTLPTKRIV